MRELRAFLASLLLVFGLCGQAGSEPMTLSGVGGATAGGGGSSCSLAGSATDAASSTTRTYSINIGTASADRLVVVAVGSQNTTPTSIVVNAVTLTQDVTVINSNSAGVYSALVTAGSGAQNVVVNGAGAFTEVGVSVWTCKGLSSNVVKHTGSASAGTASINVTAGDNLFAVASSSTNGSYAASTEAPTATHNVDTTNPTTTTAEWITIISTNAAFSVSDSGPVSCISAASYK